MGNCHGRKRMRRGRKIAVVYGYLQATVGKLAERRIGGRVQSTVSLNHGPKMWRGLHLQKGAMERNIDDRRLDNQTLQVLVDVIVSIFILFPSLEEDLLDDECTDSTPDIQSHV